MVDWLEDKYQNALLCGMADAARDLGANLVCFAGGVLASPQRFGLQRNLIYELVGPESIDALAIVAGTLGNHVGSERLRQYCERFRPLPMCSIAWPFSEIPSVLVDNATGMRQAVIHLLEAHCAREIAFIRGPEVNTEANRRYAVFREVLAEYGRPLRPELTVTGDFQYAGGEEAIRILFDERGLSPDAVLAANDYLALGALQALRKRERRVPEDVAVIGFDDVGEARFSSPPLTTVRQPLYEQGSQAARILMDALEGKPVPEEIVLHTELVVRQSCGCSPKWEGSRITDLPHGPDDTRASRWRRVARAIAHLVPLESPALEVGWNQRLVDAFVDDVERDGSAFLSQLGDALEATGQAGGDLSPWYQLIDTIRHEGLKVLDSPTRSRLEEICHAACRTVASACERVQGQQRLRAERWARTLSRTGEALITAFDVVSLVGAIAEQLPRLQIESCYLSLYEGGTTEHARLILAYDRGTRHALGPAAPRYLSRQLVPIEWLPQRRLTAHIVEPLFFKDDHLGFALFEMGPRDGAVYEALRDEISAAIKGALLVQQGVEKDQERQRLLRDLEKRAHQLEDAYEALKLNQQRLLTQEKMASLGRLTASIAHEMNTPLAAVRTALVELGRLTEEYEASLGDTEVLAADHAEIAREMRRAVRLASSSARKAVDFVRGIRTQTRDLAPSERLTFNAVPYAREALLLLTYAVRQAGCELDFRPAEDEIPLRGSPGRLAQIVTNLITNAIDASTPKGGGPILVTLRHGGDSVELRVTDHGSGISPDVVPRIFEPLFTTKPLGRGTGLGLSIVQDIVTRDFGGTIDVSTTPGLGTTFTVLFPALRVAAS